MQCEAYAAVASGCRSTAMAMEVDSEPDLQKIEVDLSETAARRVAALLRVRFCFQGDQKVTAYFTSSCPWQRPEDLEKVEQYRRMIVRRKVELRSVGIL